MRCDPHTVSDPSTSSTLDGSRGARDDRGIHTHADRSEIPRGNAKEDPLTPYARGKEGNPVGSVDHVLKTSDARPATPQGVLPAQAPAEKQGRGR